MKDTTTRIGGYRIRAQKSLSTTVRWLAVGQAGVVGSNDWAARDGRHPPSPHSAESPSPKCREKQELEKVWMAPHTQKSPTWPRSGICPRISTCPMKFLSRSRPSHGTRARYLCFDLLSFEHSCQPQRQLNFEACRAHSAHPSSSMTTGPMPPNTHTGPTAPT